MSNQYPPPDPGQDPYGQSGQSGQPPPSEPQWNPQSAGTPPPSSGGEPSYGQPGYGQPGYGQQPYGQPPPGYPPGPGAPGGYGVPQKTSPLAIVSLVLGIVGICCSQVFVLGIGAIVTGFIGRNQINQSGGQLKGGGMALAGMILGALGVVLGLAIWILAAADIGDSNFYFETN